jgi:hypothetical protein
MSTKDSRIKVIYIAGYGRSGSTLLDRMLGQIEGFFSVGELRHIWERSFIQNQLCGCGIPFKNCNFWNTIVEEAFGGFENINIKELLHLKRSVDRMRYIPALVLPWLRTNKLNNSLNEYTQVLIHLYRAICTVSGSEVIVDSTKDPSYGFILATMQDIDLQVVHLVRDSRAVAYSWQRKKRRLEIHWENALMPRYSLVKSAMEWNVMNILAQGLKRVSSHYVIVRYEDLVRNPKDRILYVLKALGIDNTQLDFINDGLVEFKVSHTVSGNPSRFNHGQIKICPDVEWKAKMPLTKRLVVSALTWPLLLRYGYLRR